MSIDKRHGEEKVQITDSEEAEESDLLGETFITSIEMGDSQKYKNWDTGKKSERENFLYTVIQKDIPEKSIVVIE